jgi:hypothetical protein
MNSQELETIFKHLASLVASGKEYEARAYLGEQLPKLPEDVRNEIMFEMFVEAVQQEAQGREGIANLQEESITAIRSLQDAKKELEDEHSDLHKRHHRH